MNIIAWNKQTDKAVIPEIAPVDGEWSYNKKTKTKRQYNKPREENKSATERSWRNSELSRTDEFIKLPDYPVDLLSYRTALRDYPAQSDFPEGVRPTI